MTFANKHNSAGRLFNFETPDGFEYTDLKGLVDQYGLKTVHSVNAIYVNTKGKYGDAPVIVTDNELVNAPAHLMKTVNEVFQDGESVSMINRGNVGFKVYTYENDFGINYGLEWVDK